MKDNISADDFDYAPVVMNSGVDWSLKHFLECKSSYIDEMDKLKQMESDSHPSPILVKSFVKDYFEDDHPKYTMQLWKQISEYIEEHESDTWVFSHIDEVEVDVNTDPWDDFEMITDQYNIYATVYSKEDVTKTQPFINQYKRVETSLQDLEYAKQRLYRELKEKFDSNV